MSQNHFDVIILGDSLASRIAGAMLAKGGLRILSFEESAGSPSPWFHSSLHLERLLERLDGRSCFTAPTPFQVLTADSRLEFQQPNTLEDELRREFAAGYDQIAGLLSDFQRLGHRLEEVLLESGGLPLLGISSRWRFIRRRLRRGLTRQSLTRPLANCLSGLRHEPGRRALAALFSGLSLTSVDKISMAETALLWNSAVRAEGVCSFSLEELLRLRFRQFHGKTEKLSGLQELQTKGIRLTGATLKGNDRFEAGFFLLGSPAGWDFIPEALHPAPRPSPQHLCFRTSPLDGMVSPLLANRVILDGKSPIRLSLSGAGKETIGLVECAAGGCPPETMSETVQETLKKALPFATFRLEPGSSAGPLPTSAPSGACRLFPGAAAPLRLQKNLFLCHGAGVLPSLGTTGDVITGMTVANHLLRTIKRRN